jgi:hypothetical protein
VPLFLNSGGKVGRYFGKMVGVWVGGLTFERKMLELGPAKQGFVFNFKTFC